MAPRRLVVAWFRENINWLADLPQPQGFPASVYYKGSNGAPECSMPFECDPSQFTLIPLQNVGREADTYLQHICTNYSDLDDMTYFVQADPAPHMLGMNRQRDKVCASLSDASKIKEGPLLTHYMTESNPPGFHERVQVRDSARYLLGPSAVLEKYSFAAGAQYAVSKEAIISRPLEFWERVRDAVIEDKVNAWEIERLWPLLFWPDAKVT